MAELTIRDASPSDYAALGELTVGAYLALPGMPGLEEAPSYYSDLRDVDGRAASEFVRIVAAYDEATGALLGGATFIDEAYGRLFGLENAAGFRMLAVAPDAQSRGVGRALVEDCIARGRSAGRRVLLLHTTPVMTVAQRMYDRFGFVRDPALDFEYEGMTVMGYQLALDE